MLEITSVKSIVATMLRHEIAILDHLEVHITINGNREGCPKLYVREALPQSACHNFSNTAQLQGRAVLHEVHLRFKMFLRSFALYQISSNASINLQPAESRSILPISSRVRLLLKHRCGHHQQNKLFLPSFAFEHSL